MSFFIILSKLFEFFLAPVNWVIVLLIWRYCIISYVWKKRLLITAVALFFIFSNEFIFIRVMKVWQPKRIETSGKHYQIGIVLGGFSTFDKYGTGYFNGSADRFVQACKLYHQGVIENILVSGGSLWRNEQSEASFVKEELVLSGVKKEDIIEEGNSRNTYENALFSKRILDSLQLKSPSLLITSSLHMPRAISIFRKAGVNVVGYPCDYKVVERETTLDDYLVPRLDILDKWSLLLKEMAGIVIYKVAGKA